MPFKEGAVGGAEFTKSGDDAEGVGLRTFGGVQPIEDGGFEFLDTELGGEADNEALVFE